MKLPPQRGEGEKWEGVQISETKHTEPLTQEITRPLYVVNKYLEIEMYLWDDTLVS